MSDTPSTLNRFLQGLQPRERMALGVASVVLLAYLLWAVALSPALHTLRTLPEQQARADRQLAEMRSLAQQASLWRERSAGAAVDRAEALRALEQATRQALGTGARISATGDRVTVQFSDVGPDALAQWLAQTRVNARLLPVESRLQRGGDTSSPRWSGHMVLAGRALASSP